MALSGVFLAKLGEVNHDQLTSVGNVGFQPYKIYYCNIADSTNQKKMKVKFFAPVNTGVKYYDWTFGDGIGKLHTISPEVEYKYDITGITAANPEYLTQSGVLPHTPSKTGIWTDVTLVVTGYDGTVVTYVGAAAIYLITGDSPVFTITYNGNGNTGGTAPVDTNEYLYGDPATIMTFGSLVKTGYVPNKIGRAHV